MSLYPRLVLAFLLISFCSCYPAGYRGYRTSALRTAEYTGSSLGAAAAGDRVRSRNPYWLLRPAYNSWLDQLINSLVY